MDPRATQSTATPVPGLLNIRAAFCRAPPPGDIPKRGILDAEVEGKQRCGVEHYGVDLVRAYAARTVMLVPVFAFSRTTWASDIGVREAHGLEKRGLPGGYL